MVKKLLIIFLIEILLVSSLWFWFKWYIKISPPKITNTEILKKEVIKVSDNYYIIDRNWIRKNSHGLWEMYVEGDGFERGVIIGKLSKNLIYKQEKVFVDKIKKMIPSENYQSFLKYLIGVFNRNIDKNIIPEYNEEIYGISLSASDDFNFIADNYQRILNYHAAHDIGHMLQNYNLVGCTSFAGWDNHSEDGKLITGRNFDFYVSDEFAEDKIVAFYKPTTGYKFMMITWGGMTGVVSGMNEKGLAITLNSAKSKIPFEAATPISLIAREILQYSQNIAEAYKIAEKRKSFVSESFLISSAADKKAIIIEKTPYKTVMFSSDSNYIICTNHFQSDDFKNEKINIENIEYSSSMYRWNRVDELIKNYKVLNIKNTCEILRDQKGLNNKNIGMGNEKAINQLIAHHSIIFKPDDLLVWVSSNPYQLGEYVCYDLHEVFSPNFNPLTYEITEKSLNLQVDSFLFSENYMKYQNFRKLKDEIYNNAGLIQSESKIEKKINELIDCNPYFYFSYVGGGDYYYSIKKYSKASAYYKLSLKYEVVSKAEEDKINDKIKDCCIKL